MLYRHIKTGEQREFVQGMKIDPLWRPVMSARSGKVTMSIVEVHPEDVRRIDESQADESNAESAISAGVKTENDLRDKMKGESK